MRFNVLLCRFSFMLTCTFLLCGSLHGQSTVGIQPFGSYATGVDQISLADLGVHITIPLYSHPERGSGLDLGFNLVYNGGTIGATGGGFSSLGPLTFFSSNLGSTSAGSIQVTQQLFPSGNPHCDLANETFSYVYIDPTGFRHTFINSHSYYDECTQVESSRGLPATATDGSGYILTAAAKNVATIVTPSGTTYTQEGTAGGNIDDSNGNTLTMQPTGPAGQQQYTSPDGVSVKVILNSSGTLSNIQGITYPDTNGNVQTVSINYKQYAVYITNDNTSVPPGPDEVPFVDSVVYPDGTSYSFSYEPSANYPGCYTGRLSAIKLPTGGTIQYQYSDNTTNNYDYTSTLTRTTADGSTTYQRQITSYSPPAGGQGSYTPFATSTTTVTTADGIAAYNFINESLADFDHVYQISASTYQGSSASGVPLKQVATCYMDSSGSCSNQAFELSFPIEQVSTSTSYNGGPASKVLNSFNSVGLPTETDLFDYGASTPTSKTVTQYATLGNNILDRPSSITVQNGSGNTVSQTTYGYDDYSLATSNAPNLSAVSGARGNRTSEHDLVSTNSSTTLDSHIWYDDAGQVIKTTDPNTNMTQYAYDSATDSCLNKTTYPASTTGFVPVTSQVCDPNTGLITSTTNPNGSITTYTYDALLRTTGTAVTSGSTTYASTSYCYSGSSCSSSPALPATVTKTVLATPSPSQVTTTTLDGLGRTVSVVEPNGATVASTYDALGRLQSVTNPYSSTGDATYGITSYLYDALGRKTDECEPDNASSPSTTCTPGSSYQSWQYNVGLVTYKDENGHQWQRTSDGLGRLIKVLEPDPASGVDNVETDYTYDPLNNLLQVDQWGSLNPANGSDVATCLSPNGAAASGASCDRQRTFQYDALSRLLTATTPESGTVSYMYDSDSKVHTRTNANGVVTTYSYDGLNRLIGKTYTDSTPPVSYSYDNPVQGWNFLDQTAPVWTGVQQTNLAGRLSSESTAGSTIVYGYDPVGRTVLKSECTPSTCGSDHYDLHAIYDLAGNPTFVDRGLDAARNAATPNAGYYFGGLSMAYTPAGQLQSATADISDSAHPANILQNITYTPTGQEQTAELASQFAQVSKYDNRERRTTRFSADLTGQLALGDSWSYDKHSNVIGTSDSQQGNFGYVYDNLNRVSQGTFGSNTVSYGYDPWGNQTSHVVVEGSSYQWSYMPTTQNRSTVTGSSYDAAGNMLADGQHQYTYNAEGQVAGVTDQGVTYSYDPEGQRVATAGGPASGTEYLTDIFGHLVTTLNANHTMVRGILRDNLGSHRGDYVGGPQGSGSSEFRLVNQVGTLVVNADGNGNFVEGCLSGPFGDGQSCTYGYDYTETHFTDKLRDAESNNDYFGARYFNSTLGRFTSPDPSGLGFADPTNPQSLNLYSYGLNNPLTNTDPTGLSCVTGDDGTQADDGDGQGCDAAGILASTDPDNDPNQFDPNKTQTVNVNAPPPGADLNFDAQVAYDQLILARMQPASLTSDQYRTAIIQQVARNTAGFPDVCSGGAFAYAGVQADLGKGHAFGGYLGNYDSKGGATNGGIVEGSGHSAGVAGAYSNNGGPEGLVFVPFAEAGGAIVGVSKEGLAIGGYVGTPDEFPIGAGGGGYFNISTLGACSHP